MTKNTLALGQMFLVGFRGCDLKGSHWLIQALQQHDVGGVILFDRNVDGSCQNIHSPEQLSTLTQTIGRLARSTPFIGVDQEGGRVCRLKSRDGFLPSESAATLAQQGPAAVAREAEAAAVQLAGCGINLNFAPVVDLNLNPDNPIIARYDRSYGSDPQQVVTLARAMIAAHRRHHIATCLKHFPGHGSAGADSHLGFVDISSCWQEKELRPFQMLINQGYADSVMTAHLVQQGLDAEQLPATLSPAIIKGLLRAKLGFEGVVFSDDLQMRAISSRWSYREAVQKAVLAGVDVLVIGNNLDLDEEAVTEGIAAIQALLDSGQLREQSVVKSIARIQRLKQQTSHGG